jgi:MYXO-CTERM domain-containing protein
MEASTTRIVCMVIAVVLLGLIVLRRRRNAE